MEEGALSARGKTEGRIMERVQLPPQKKREGRALVERGSRKRDNVMRVKMLEDRGRKR